MKKALINWWLQDSKSPPTKFDKLEILNWKQFAKIEIKFHEKLTILTGPNASGKTTILNTLAANFGWSIDELNVPNNKSGQWRFFNRTSEDSINNTIGKITYKNGELGIINRSVDDSPTYQFKVDNQQNVQGYYIPSYRPTFRYLPVEHSSRKPNSIAQLFKEITSLFKSITSLHDKRPSNFYIKQTLLKCNELHESSRSSKEYEDYFIGFQEVLKKMLPSTLEFVKLEVRKSEVIVVTAKSEWMIDGASGGISAIIDMIWQIFIIDKESTNGITILIDEIENHLHASMQRSILPNLVTTFPQVQFIIATHSPLIIGSVKESHIYTLQYNNNLKIESFLLDLKNKPKSATEILNQILGVNFTMPIWVENELKRIVDELSNKDFDKETLNLMREKLASIGLEDLMPEAINDLINGKVNKGN